MDIKIKELENNKTDNLSYSNLKLLFSGKNVSNIIINAFRRIIFDEIPTYAFAPEKIIIEKNTTIFNNDQIKLRLSQLPINNIDTGLDYLEEKYWKNVNFNDPEREKHKNEKNIRLYIKSENNISENISIKDVTTNDISYFVDDVKIDNIYNKKYPILLTKLKQNCELICNLTGVIGIGKNNIRWSPVSNAYFTVYDDNLFTFNLFSNGQITEYEILLKACKNINYKLETIKNNIKQLISSDYKKNSFNDSYEFIFNLDSLTIGNIINEKLQQHKDVSCSGIAQPSYLNDDVIIKIELIKKDKIDNILIECIDECIKTYDTIYNILKKMNK